MEKVPGFLTVDWILAQFHRERKRATKLYRDFVKAGRGVEAWGELRGGILLGGDEFVEKLKPLLSDFAALKELPRRERLTGRPSLPKLFAKVRGKEERNARIHEALRVHGYTLQDVADATGLHYSTVSRIAKQVAGDSVPTERARGPIGKPSPRPGRRAADPKAP
jgi:putative transposase